MTKDSTKDPKWQALLDQLAGQVQEEMAGPEAPAAEEQAALARDYRSFLRMGHAPAQARRLAEQLAFQQRWYLEEEELSALGLAVTEMLAQIYEKGLEQSAKRAATRPKADVGPHSGQ